MPNIEHVQLPNSDTIYDIKVESVNFAIYNNLSQIGRSSGDTLASVVQTLADYSSTILIVNAGDMVTGLPSGFAGTIVIVARLANNSRTSIFALGARESDKDYRMFMVNNGGTYTLSGTWVPIHEGSVTSGTVTKVMSETLDTDSSSVECDGHLAVLNLAFRYNSGFPTGQNWITVYNVTPKPTSAKYVSYDFQGQSITVRILPESGQTYGSVQVLPHGSAFTQLIRTTIPYFY